MSSKLEGSTAAKPNDVQASGKPNDTKGKSCVGRLVRFFLHATDFLVFATLIVASLSSLLRLDEFAIGMPLTYSPRMLWLLVAVVLAFCYLCLRRFKRLTIVAILAMLLCYDATWGIAKRRQFDGPLLTLLSFNTHYANGEDIAKLCAIHDVDILCLQETSPSMGPRREFIGALPEYQFFTGDRDAKRDANAKWYFTCITGVRQSLLEQPRSTEVDTAITKFRSFAVKVNLNQGPLWLINVHTTKPVTLRRKDIKLSLKDTLIKAERHRSEYELLRKWLDVHEEPTIPMLVAGDFNAPGNTQNLRFPDLKNAQREAGRGFLLTFPARFPVFGIDHVLGNESIEFQSCEVLNTGLSDHRAMLVRFKLKQ